MTNEQKEKLMVLTDEYYDWWGWEGYTYEDASGFFEGMADSFLTLLQEIEANNHDKK